MFDLDEEEKYLLINNKEIEQLLQEVCDLADGLRDLMDKKKHHLLSIKGYTHKLKNEQF